MIIDLTQMAEMPPNPVRPFRRPQQLNDCHCGGGLAGMAQSEEAAGATTTMALAQPSAVRAVGLGVLTGLTVWGITRLLDGRADRRRR